MPEVIGQNPDGSYVVKRDNGSTFASAIIPPGLSFTPPASAPAAAPGADMLAWRAGQRPAQQPSGPAVVPEVDTVARYVDTLPAPAPRPAPGAPPVLPTGPSPVQQLVTSTGLGFGPAVPPPPKPSSLPPGVPREFNGFRGDPATLQRTPDGQGWTPGGVNATPYTARPDPIPVPASQSERPEPPPLDRSAFVGPSSSGVRELTTLRVVSTGNGGRKLEKAYEDYQKAVTEKAAVEAGQAQVEAAALEATQQEQEAREARRLDRQAKREEFVRQQEDTLRATMAEAAKPEGEVDPNRWWKSRDTGGKILAGLATVLAGFAKGLSGRDVVNPVREAIAQDIALQRESIDRKAKRTQQAVGNQSLLLETMRQRFGDEIQAERAAEAYGLQIAQTRLQALLAGTKDKERLARGQEAAAQLEVAKVEAMNAHNIRAAQLAMAREEATLRAEAGAAKGGGRPVPAGDASTIGEFDTAVQAVKDLRKAWNAKTGALSGATQYIPGTDAAQYEDDLTITAQVVGTILEGGKLTDADFPKYMRLLPQAGDSKERAEAKVQNVERLIRLRQRAKVEGLGRAGYDVSGLAAGLPPASLQQHTPKR